MLMLFRPIWKYEISVYVLKGIQNAYNFNS